MWDDEPYEDDETSTMEPFEADLVDGARKPIMMHSLTDTLINAEVLLSKDDSAAIAQVARRAVDSKGKMIGTWDENPILNTLVYECEFEDGTIREYAANTIFPTYMKRATLTDSCPPACFRLWNTSPQVRQSQ